MESAVEQLVRVLAELDARRIRHAAIEIQRRQAEPGDDLAWWEATMAVDRALAAARRSVLAANAGRTAAEAVTAAARRAGLDAHDPDVVVLARRARLCARAAVAGAGVHRHAQYLRRGWWDTVLSPAVPDGLGSVA